MNNMPHGIDQVLLRPGVGVTFADRDDLLEKLDTLSQRIPGRDEGRTRDHREHFCIVRYLCRLAGGGLLDLPLILSKTPEGQDPPDFTLEWPESGDRETFELTDGSTVEYQERLTRADKSGEDRDDLWLPVDINTPDREAAQLWAEVLFASFLRKAQALIDGRFQIDHLLLYDLTGLGLFIPVEEGAPLLREKIKQWYRVMEPANRFGRISVLRDTVLLLDLTGEARLLRAESPYFQLDVVRARDEEGLGRRLREIDRYCRDHSIRHLKTFGSVLGDREDEFTEPTGLRRFVPGTSDLDLLVDFEPGAQITLLDMARMERELSELIGLDVDLRTAEDLSRYFRQQVVEEAVELHAQRV